MSGLIAPVLLETAAEVVALTVQEAGEFLQKHPDVIRDVLNALALGATKEDIKRGIRSSIVATAEEALEGDIGPRPADHE